MPRRINLNPELLKAINTRERLDMIFKKSISDQLSKISDNQFIIAQHCFKVESLKRGL